MENEQIAVMSNPVMPNENISSRSVKPKTPRRRDGLVDVILKSIAGNVRGEFAVALQAPCLPGKMHRYHFHVVAVRRSDGGVSNRHCSLIRQTYVGDAPITSS